MTQEKNMIVNQKEVEESFTGEYSKKVHIIGRVSIIIVLILSFLPVLYMYFVKGYQMPVEKYLNVAFAITALCVGFWLTEPFTWFPILGSAAMYMGYIAGNVKNIRVPVARQLRSKYGLSAAEPKGQIITTIGVAISVYVNLIILTVIVVFGSFLVSVLPAIVIDSFTYVIPSLIGALLAFRISESGWLTTLKWSVPAILIFALMKTGVVGFLVDFGMSTSIAVTILIGYILYKIQGGKAEKNE